MKNILFLLLFIGIFSFAQEYAIVEGDTIRKNDELRQAMLPFIKNEKYGVGVIKSAATEGYSSTGATFTIYNSSKKTIKYIWFTVAGENAVGDLVKTGGSYYKTLKGIGPTEGYKFGQWSFDYVWLTDIVEILKLSTIKIQYMDGTYKTVKYNDNLYIGEAAYERALLAISNDDKQENVVETHKKKFEDVSEEDQTVFTEVELSAEYPGGMGALRNTISNNFDTSQMIDQSGKLETELSFVIEKNGGISNVTATGNNEEFNKEAIRAIKSIRSIWTPAKINSVKVRSIYKHKFSMVVEK